MFQATLNSRRALCPYLTPFPSHKTPFLSLYYPSAEHIDLCKPIRTAPASKCSYLNNIAVLSPLLTYGVGGMFPTEIFVYVSLKCDNTVLMVPFFHTYSRGTDISPRNECGFSRFFCDILTRGNMFCIPLQ